MWTFRITVQTPVIKTVTAVNIIFIQSVQLWCHCIKGIFILSFFSPPVVHVPHPPPPDPLKPLASPAAQRGVLIFLLSYSPSPSSMRTSLPSSPIISAPPWRSRRGRQRGRTRRRRMRKRRGRKRIYVNPERFSLMWRALRWEVPGNHSVFSFWFLKVSASFQDFHFHQEILKVHLVLRFRYILCEIFKFSNIQNDFWDPLKGPQASVIPSFHWFLIFPVHWQSPWNSH